MSRRRSLAIPSFKLSRAIPPTLLRGQETDVRTLGAKLGVDYVVEGSARREGDQLRVSAQLIDLGTGTHLWSRSFDRKVADVFSVQSELTTEIVAQLAPYIGRSEAAAAALRPTDNLQAYDLVLQARDLLPAWRC